jgi:hypothetical protein
MFTHFPGTGTDRRPIVGSETGEDDEGSESGSYVLTMAFLVDVKMSILIVCLQQLVNLQNHYIG